MQQTSAGIDVLTSSVVLVFQPLPSANMNLTQRDLEEILEAPVDRKSIGPSGLAFTSVRKQVEITIGLGRLDVKDLSGKQPEATLISGILWPIKDKLKPLVQRVSAFGFNYELSVPVPSGTPAGGYIKDRLLALPKGFDVLSTSITLRFDRTPKKYQLRIEPRYGDSKAQSIFVYLNAHEDLLDTSKDLDQSEAAKGYIGEYQNLVSVLKELKLN